MSSFCHHDAWIKSLLRTEELWIIQDSRCEKKIKTKLGHSPFSVTPDYQHSWTSRDPVYHAIHESMDNKGD